MTTDIEDRHRRQLAVMRGFLNGKGWWVAADALEIVRNLEQGTRKDGVTPKFDHQLSVAQLLITLSPNFVHPEETVTAAFLHDLYEDHGAVWSLDRMSERFGPQVSETVWSLSKKSEGIVKDYTRYFADMTSCPIASLVKLSDRVHNIHTMVGVFTLEKQKEYLEELDLWFFPMIRQARRNFPRQFPAYENLRINLVCQRNLIQHIHDALEAS